jgi:hypothetical protein
LIVFLTVTFEPELFHQEAKLEYIGHVHADMVEQEHWLHLSLVDRSCHGLRRTVWILEKYGQGYKGGRVQNLA